MSALPTAHRMTASALAACALVATAALPASADHRHP
ncbi:lamin tail domain-containing protein, partial [Streptomyces sp. GC420]|nr:lamin tail domain-containing protein [Streptomyces sp. GC420]